MRGGFFFAIPSRRNLSLASLLFNSVADRRPVLEKGRQGRQEPAGDGYGSLLQTGIVAKFEKFLQFFQKHPNNYIFRHVVAGFGLHSSNFLREKRSSSPPGRFQTMICSKVRDQRNSKHAVHFKSANQRFAIIALQIANPAGQRSRSVDLLI